MKKQRDIQGALIALLQAGVILHFEKIKSAEFGGKNTCTAGKAQGDTHYHIYYYNKLTPWGEHQECLLPVLCAQQIIKFCGRNQAWQIAVDNQRKAIEDGKLKQRLFQP